MIKETKPYTLKSVYSRAVTAGGKLYVFDNLQPKDPSMSKVMIKTPVRIVDFKTRKLDSV